MRLRTAIIVGFTLLVALSAAGAFGICVWPTRYRYDQVKMHDNVFPIRIDRISGATYLFDGYGWQPADDDPAIVPLPSDEISKLQADSAQFDSLTDTLSCKIYNGSSYRVKEVVVHLQVKSPKSVDFGAPAEYRITARDYRLTYPDDYVERLQVQTLQAPIGFVPAEDDTWSWRIVGASGIKQ